MKNKRRLFWKVCLFVLFIGSGFPIAGMNPAKAEGPLDPAPQVYPTAPNGKKVLFDNTHGQTAGSADWVIDGAFSDFANAIAKEGYFVQELRKTTPITYDDLKNFDVFVVPEANIPYKTSEQEAMIQYVQNGGSIFFISDHYNADRNKNRWDSSEVFNGYRRGAFDNPKKGMSEEEAASEAMKDVQCSDWLADHFGVRFRYNAIGDVNATTVVDPNDSFGITEGVHSLAVHAGSTLAILDPEKAKGLVYLPKLTKNDKWNDAVDQGVYFGGDIEEGPFVAISKVGKGKAAFIGDSSSVEDASPKYFNEETGTTKKTYDGFKEQDDAKILTNLVNWLSVKESYPSFKDQGITLDKPSPILNTEIPSQSTEPQPEPWAPPAAGYKWYDPSTFKDGSYGSTKTPDVKPTYSFLHQDVLPNAEEFQIGVSIDHLLPGQTVNGLNVGIFLVGGEQVAQFQNQDGAWPGIYGYSSSFSVTADSSGHATKVLTVKIKPGIKGSAKLRLRNGKTNLFTQDVAIGNVESILISEKRSDIPEKHSIEEARNTEKGTAVKPGGTVISEPICFWLKRIQQK